MQPANVSIELGTIKLCHSASNLEVDLSTSVVCTSTNLDHAAIRDKISLLIVDPSSTAIYIDRSSQLAVDISVTISDMFICEHDKIGADVVTMLSQAELWSQLRWKCVSSEQEKTSALSTTIRLAFVNDGGTEVRKRRLHKIDQDVPFYDVKAPHSMTKAQVTNIHWRLHIGGTVSMLENIMPDIYQVDDPQYINRQSSPVTSETSQMLCVEDNDSDFLEPSDHIMDLYTSSPLIRPDNNDADVTICTTVTSNLASSPPSLMLSTAEPSLEHINEQHLRTLLDLAVRKSIHHQGIRATRAIAITSSDGFQQLASLAPSMFLPGFTESMATRAPFISRVTAALEACTTSDASSSRLWVKAWTDLRSRHSKSRLKPLQLPNEPPALACSPDNEMLEECTSNEDLISSSDTCDLLSDDAFDDLHPDETSW